MANIDIRTRNIEERPSVKLISLKGDLDILGSNELTNQVTGIIRDDHHDIIMDLKELNYINSTGIFVITRLFSRMQNNGRKLVLISVNKNIQEILEVIGLLEIIPCYKDVDSALKNLD